MQDVKRLVTMVGLPRSGKSTIARDMGHPVVCPDEIRLALHGEAYIQSAEPYVWAIAKTMVKSLFRAGHDIVILDAANNTKKRRDEWRSYDGEWLRVLHTVETGPNVCVERAKADGREELIPVIERMASQHEPVTEAELLEGEGMNILGEDFKKKIPLSIDIYDHRNVVIRKGDNPLGYIHGINFQASMLTAPTLDVVLPELSRDEMTDEQGERFSFIIDTLQAHGARIVFAPLSEITPEENPTEQGLAEGALQQLGFVRRSSRTVDESDRPTLEQMFDGDENDGS